MNENLEPKLITGGISVDDRGETSFINDFKFDNIQRFYQIRNHARNIIRAWYGHEKETKFVYVVSGTALIGVMPMRGGDRPRRFTISAKRPRMLEIPPGNYYGFKMLEDNTVIMLFCTASLEQSKEDDIKQPWDRWNIWRTSFR